MDKEKQICSEPDCYIMIDKEDIIIRGDGTPHPISLKCFNCQGDDRRKLKAYKKRQRNKANKKSREIK